MRVGGEHRARLYGDDPGDGIGGAGAFFLLTDEPEVYGLPPDPVVTTRHLPGIWKSAGVAAGALVAGDRGLAGGSTAVSATRELRMVERVEPQSYYGRP